MNWNKDKSVVLSQALIIFFALALLAVDIAGLFRVSRYLDLEADIYRSQLIALRVLMYASSVPAWIALWKLWMLMKLLSRGEVFSANTVSTLRVISWCCFAVALISLACLPFIHASVIVVTAAAALMGLIVRMVKNVVQQATEMKNELDYTV